MGFIKNLLFYNAQLLMCSSVCFVGAILEKRFINAFEILGKTTLVLIHFNCEIFYNGIKYMYNYKY